MSLPTDLPSCGEPAITVFEVFTRTENGYSLDGRLNVCGAHVVAALTTLRAASFEPHQATGTAGVPGRCGDGFDYEARTALTAPIREESTMSHPIEPPEPPNPALMISRLNRATDSARRGDYTPAVAALLAANALGLALAAGLPDEHRLLAEVLAARAAYTAGDTTAGAQLAKLAPELADRIASWGVAASDGLWRADRDAAHGSPRSPR